MGGRQPGLVHRVALACTLGSKPPDKDKESNWLPAPPWKFSIWLRAYWPDAAILEGTWQPPKIERAK